MQLIVAVSYNNAIGKDNKLPWHNPKDLAWFKLFTTGRTIAMGKNTFSSVGSLPGRTTIVLDRSMAIQDLPEDTIIVGGAQVYAAAVQYCTQLLVSRIMVQVPDADAFFEVPSNFKLATTIDMGTFILEVYEKNGPEHA